MKTRCIETLLVMVLAIWLCVFAAAAAETGPGGGVFADSGQSLGDSSSTGVALGDVDGDGDLDAFVANYYVVGGPGQPSLVWLNDGAGVFYDSGQRLDNASSSFDTALGDLDNDGDLDAFVVNYNQRNSVWFNDGSGVFSDSNQNLGLWKSEGVALGDVDGDGDLDAFVANYGESNAVWVNIGGGIFSDSGQSLDLLDSTDAVLGDLDGDGDLDAFITNYSQGNEVWLNDGSGVFSNSGQGLGSGDSTGVALGDVDGDGDLDAFVTNLSQSSVVWRNDGSALFTDSAQALVAFDSNDVALGDLDGDGDLDAFVTDASGGGGRVLKNIGGLFTDSGQRLGVENGRGIALGDLDGDGDLDAFVNNNDAQPNQVWKNTTIHRNAVFVDGGDFPIGGVVNGVPSVIAADIDGDGDEDVLSAARGAGSISWFENSAGDGTTWLERTIKNTFDGASAVATADMDGDGHMDVVGAAYNGDAVAWWQNSAGDGTSWLENTIPFTVLGPVWIEVADMDGDGDMDVLVSSNNDNAIRWFDNIAGDGSAWSETFLPGTLNVPAAVSAADVDGDGDLDVLATAREGDAVYWFNNTAGDGTLWSMQPITTGFDGAVSVCPADVDGDGDIDVVASAEFAGAISWFENTVGDGTSWSERTVEGVFNSVRPIYVADMDNDGDVDIVAGGYYSATLAWWENLVGDGSAWFPHVMSTTFSGPGSVFAADMDGDGDRDVLVSGDDATGLVVWWENWGGQVALITIDTAQPSLNNAQTDDVLQIIAVHMGRTEDGDVELASLELRFEDFNNTALTSLQANAVFERLLVYLDDGSGLFEIDNDTLVTVVDTLSLDNGTQTVLFVDGDPNVQVAYGIAKTFFVVLELTSDAESQTVPAFRVIHVIESSSTAEDRENDIPLLLEFAPNMFTKLINIGGGSCSFALIPANDVFGFEGGSGTVDVEASDNACAWTAVSNDTWISITAGAGGTGPGTVVYTVQANEMGPRSGSMAIGGNTFVVDQDGIASSTTTSLVSPSTTSTTSVGTVSTTTTSADVTVTTTTSLPATGTSTTSAPPDTTTTLAPASLTARFTAVPTEGAAPLSVKFLNTSLGDIDAYAWDFGDGTAGTVRAPEHVYSKPGTYTVGLTVSGPDGSDILVRQAYITVGSAPVKAAFSAEPTVGNVPLTVVFTDLSEGSPDRWLWGFGDGKAGTDRNPTHTYTQPGTYTVRLGVQGGLSADAVIKEDYIVVQKNAPSAAFSASVTAGTAPLTVRFSNLSTGDIDSWNWNFGDGNTAAERAPSHTYENPGVYTVGLLVRGPGGRSSEIKNEYISVDSRSVERYAISGTVTGDVTAGVDVYLTGDVRRGTVTGEGGSYVFDRLMRGSYRVTPRLRAAAFAPASRQVTIAAQDVGKVDFGSTLQGPDIEAVTADLERVAADGRTTVTFLAQVSHPGGLDMIQEVRIGLQTADALIKEQMLDNGSNGDDRAGDGVYTYQTVLPPSITPGEKALVVVATDRAGFTDSGIVRLQVISHVQENLAGASVKEYTVTNDLQGQRIIIRYSRGNVSLERTPRVAPNAEDGVVFLEIFTPEGTRYLDKRYTISEEESELEIDDADEGTWTYRVTNEAPTAQDVSIATGSSGTGVVTGFVVDAETGEGLDNVQIVTDLGGSSVTAAGYYVLLQVAGVFTMQALHPDYVAVPQTGVLSAGQSLELNMALSKGGGAPMPNPCAAEEALGGSGGAAVGMLRRFRDTRLAATPEGRRYLGLYYRHSPEVVSIMRKDPDVARAIRASLVILLPSVRSVLQGQELSLNAPQRSVVRRALALIQARAGERLKKDIGVILEEGINPPVL